MRNTIGLNIICDFDIIWDLVFIYIPYRLFSLMTRYPPSFRSVGQYLCSGSSQEFRYNKALNQYNVCMYSNNTEEKYLHCAPLNWACWSSMLLLTHHNELTHLCFHFDTHGQCWPLLFILSETLVSGDFVAAESKSRAKRTAWEPTVGISKV